MRTIVHFTLVSVALLLVACQEKVSVSYPAPLPSDELIKFLPGIVSTDSFEFNALFAPDGKTFYFAKDEIHDIYETSFNGTSWSAPVSTSFSEKEFKECDPAFSPDGRKLFYISTKKRSPIDSIDDFDIWYVEREDDKWSQPRNLEVVNSDSSEFYVSLSDNGNLYFASNRAGGFGSHDIYVSRFINGSYTRPENLGEAVNDSHRDHDAFITLDERVLIFTSSGRDGGLGKGDLYYSVKNQDDSWSRAKNLGTRFNTADYDYCPYITPDGKYFFLSDNKDIRWVNAKALWDVIGK
jgi:Tol biopolymer transport system component